MASRLGEPIVKRHEGERLARLALQIEAAGDLHGVAGSNWRTPSSGTVHSFQ
jgi:hypothetical protein